MGLPSYVVNFDEIFGLLEDALKDVVVRGISDIKGTQKVRGFAESIPPLQGVFKVLEHTFSEDSVLTGITYSQSAWKGEDFWELWVGDDRVFETVYTKELGEQKHWEVVHPVEAGKTVRLLLNNESGNSRDVWVDLEYVELLGEIDTP